MSKAVGIRYYGEMANGKTTIAEGIQVNPIQEQSVTVPEHVVLFPDGNRRWAKEQGLNSLEGHMKGKEKFEDFMVWCKKRGVKVVTVFGFSTENWKRSEQEVNYLMDLFEKYLGDKDSIARFQKEGVRVRVIGQKARLRPSLQKVIENVEQVTENNTEFNLNLAVSYGGRWDILNALQNIMKAGVAPDDVTEDMISSHISTADLPEPDLVIRAGGEKRFSNFLLWQSAYAELHFCPKYWPDFTEQDLEEAFQEYARRTRRFGGN